MGKLLGHSQQSVQVLILVSFYKANIKKITAHFQLLANSYEFCRDFVLAGLGWAVGDKGRG